MASRLKLHEELCEILETKNVYFNSPASVRMSYPCIRYKLGGMDTNHAANKIYNKTNRYEITVIDRDPDCEIHNKLLERFEMINFDRSYISDNLYHFVLTLYY